MGKITSFDELPKIIAVDFDGTIVEDRYPDIGKPKYGVIVNIKALRACGVKVIIWTSRNGDWLEDALEFCESIGLEFDAVNTNIDEVKELTGMDTRKVYADLYLDDKATLPFADPWWWSSSLNVDYVELSQEMRKVRDELCLRKAQ